ncbi:hypothetical protein [Acutalibacter muris]|uniref:hypothetical protein n=1 Tax=Acutalibacter muris TaxID=1796620 RepID=UPI001C3ED70B|nr:hypothetical protein [Acutalibacter muris]
MIRSCIQVSPQKQAGTSLEDQRAALLAAGCQTLYEDVGSWTALTRPEFEKDLITQRARAGMGL